MLKYAKIAARDISMQKEGFSFEVQQWPEYIINI